MLSIEERRSSIENQVILSLFRIRNQKASPSLLVGHIAILQPYLNPSSSIKEDAMILQHVATIMERIVPLIEYPDAEFLSQLEKDLTTPLYKQGMAVIQSLIKCLCTVVSKVSLNFSFLKGFYLSSFRTYLSDNQMEIPSGTERLFALCL